MYTLLALTTFFSLIAAAPTEKRDSCKTLYPSYLGIIDSAFPDMNFGHVGRISTSIASPAGSFRVAQVQFQVPLDARGACQLEYIFPSTHNIISSGVTQLQVYKTTPAPSHASINFTPGIDTWNTSPAFGSQFGTFDVVRNTRGTINSEGCSPTLNYYVSLYEPWQIAAGQARPGHLIFYEDYIPGVLEGGLRLRNGC